jgi:threonine dehydrogenase-like Zn-dependent dehydrogenase
MRSIAVDYSKRKLVERSIAEPVIGGWRDVLFQIREVGVCGTDREIAACRLGVPPARDQFLVLGHEALGQVIETGAEVTELAAGDWVVPAIRRSCGTVCPSCARNRRDLCLSGDIVERGIFRLHGYLTERAVDDAQDLIRVPESLVPYAVLIEPLSVVEKAISTALAVHPGEPSRAAILGAGPIGLLAGLALKARGLDVRLSSLESQDSPRARLIREAGMDYGTGPAADIVIEATGSAAAAFAGFSQLAPLGVYMILGAPNARGDVPFERIIVNNQRIAGSVNASLESFRAAVDDLVRFEPGILDQMIERVSWTEFSRAIQEPPLARPKVVLVAG